MGSPFGRFRIFGEGRKVVVESPEELHENSEVYRKFSF